MVKGRYVFIPCPRHRLLGAFDGRRVQRWKWDMTRSMGCRLLEHRVDGYSVLEQADRRSHQAGTRRGRRMKGNGGSTYSQFNNREGTGNDPETAMTGTFAEGKLGHAPGWGEAGICLHVELNRQGTRELT